MSEGELYIKFNYKIKGKMIILVSKSPGVQITAPISNINSVIIKKEYGSYWLYINVGGVEYYTCGSIAREPLQHYQSKLFKDIGWS